jgi:hypothetical protein
MILKDSQAGARVGNANSGIVTSLSRDERCVGGIPGGIEEGLWGSTIQRRGWELAEVSPEAGYQIGKGQWSTCLSGLAFSLLLPSSVGIHVPDNVILPN